MPPVLVVGAGPTGLALACLLRRHHADVRVVDRLPEPAQLSKAMVIWSRTLEVLDEMGVADAVVRAGGPLRRARYSEQGQLLADIATDTVPGTRWQPIVLPQNSLERILRDRLSAMGVRVEWATRVDSVADGDDSCRVVLRRDDGTIEKIEAPYVVGCDGMRSTVRDVAGISWTEGAAYEEVFALGEVDADTELDRTTAHHFLGRHGVAVALAVPGGGWRVAGYLDGEEPAPRPDAESLQRLLDTCGVTGLTIGAVTWSGAFRVLRRLAGSFREGRLLLAGDAAHVHSPAGGQGLNTGIQDVHGLAWRLSLVLRGLAGEQLLDTYGAERHAVAAQILRLTKLQDDWLFGARSVAARVARNVAVRGLSRAGIFETRVVPDLAQLTVSYRRSPLTVGAVARGSRYRPGHRMPDVDVLDASGAGSTGLREACSGAGVVLVLVPGPGRPVPAGATAALEGLAGLYPGAVRVVRLSSPLPDTVTVPADGYLLGLRGDGYVGYRGTHAVGPALHSWLHDGLALRARLPVPVPRSAGDLPRRAVASSR